MKVSDLKLVLEHADPNEEVMIQIKLPYSTVGSSPMVSIKLAGSGFDWDTNKFIIFPSEDLTPSDHDFAKMMREMQEKLGWLEYEKRGLKSEIKKLKSSLTKVTGESNEINV